MKHILGLHLRQAQSCSFVLRCNPWANRRHTVYGEACKAVFKSKLSVRRINWNEYTAKKWATLEMFSSECDRHRQSKVLTWKTDMAVKNLEDNRPWKKPLWVSIWSDLLGQQSAHQTNDLLTFLYTLPPSQSLNCCVMVMCSWDSSSFVSIFLRCHPRDLHMRWSMWERWDGVGVEALTLATQSPPWAASVNE